MLNGEGALDHKSRKLIYNYISSHPGASFGTIRNFLDMNDSTLKYHLIYLERNNKVISKREGRHRCYFCNNGSKLNYRPYLSSQLNSLTRNQQQILKIIRNKPGISKNELIKITNLNRKTLSYNLNKLIERNIIWKVKSAGEIGYEYITKEKLRNEIYNRLLLKLLSDEIDEDKFLKIKKKLDNLGIDEIRI